MWIGEALWGWWWRSGLWVGACSVELGRYDLLWLFYELDMNVLWNVAASLVYGVVPWSASVLVHGESSGPYLDVVRLHTAFLPHCICVIMTHRSVSASM